jgi:aminoglycoside 3'-phosphotransferase-2
MTSFDPTAEDFDIPPAWRDLLLPYRWHRQTAGQSGAEVFRLEAEGREKLFVKVEETSSSSEVAAEAPRLRWLFEQNVPCPPLRGYETHAERNWLLSGAVPGRDLTAAELPEATIVATLAAGLRRLHALPVSACPFDHRLDIRVAQAQRRMQAGSVDTSDIGEPHRGRPPEDLFALLCDLKPADEDLVVAHGDACLANVMADAQGRFTGFVDCGRLGIADRAQDLTLACRSIEDDLDALWIPPFLAAYGAAPLDHRRDAFFRLLDEFF